MKNRTFSLAFSFLALMCSSCSTLTYFDLPVYQLSEKPFPAMGGKMILVNNAAEQPKTTGSFFVDARNKEHRLIFERDSANFPMLNILGNSLLESEFIEDVVIYNKPFRTDSLYRSAQVLEPSKIDTILGESGMDWVLSLDAMPHYIEIRESLLPDFNLINASLQIQVFPILTLYKKGKDGVAETYHVSDTVYWNSTQFDLNAAVSSLPPLNDCFLEALYKTGEKIVDKWLPKPIVEKRCWVDHPHSIMREASVFFIKGDFESAAYMWEYGYENIKSQKVRYYAAYNRGILAEMNGNLQSAVEWLEKARMMKPENTSLHKLDVDDIISSIRKQLFTQQLLLPLL